MFESVDRAIRTRFARVGETIPGVRVEEDPFPGDTSTRTTVGYGNSPGCCPPVKLFVPLGGQLYPVVVFQETREGHSVDINATIEFQPVRTRFRNEEGVTGIDVEDLGQISQRNSQGQTVWGPNLRRVRPKATPESIYYDFHVEARHYSIATSLLQMITTLFPPLGSLEVTRLNGCQVFFDMIRTTDPFRSSTFDATLNANDPDVRKYRWTAQYEVEAYEDNSLQGQYRQTINSRCVTPVALIGSTEVVPKVEQP